MVCKRTAASPLSQLRDKQNVYQPVPPLPLKQKDYSQKE
jgi:hypothetical protein